MNGRSIGNDGQPKALRNDAVTRPIPTEALPALRPPLGARHQLLVWLGESVQPWGLPEYGASIIGRAMDADIRIDSLAVSRHHAQLTIKPDGITIADLGSANGTRVNGERLTGPRTLSYGDIITFGDITSVVGEDRRTGMTPPKGSPLEASAQGFGILDRTLYLGDRTVLVADPAMAHVYTQLARLAPTELSVLILGETGSGKELAASAIRLWSKRREGPLVSINCAALPGDLAESELFGYERGAFSGAVGAKPGLLEAAHGGTVLFDEIGDLPLPVQAKLLRVIETRRLTRLGSVREHAIDVRVVAATHRDLEVGVKTGWFRADLYYRLGVAIVRIPPLRARRRELPLLAARFVEDACRSLGRPPLLLGQDAVAALMAHHWPGNVRELKNVLDCVAVAANGPEITAELIEAHLLHLADDGLGAVTPGPLALHPNTATTATPATPTDSPDTGGAPRTGLSDETGPLRPLAEANRAFERRTIETALAQTHGNKTHAAKRLGVPLRTFMDKIKRYGL